MLNKLELAHSLGIFSKKELSQKYLKEKAKTTSDEKEKKLLNELLEIFKRD